MAQTRKEIRDAYNRKAYKQYNFRVRRDSDLFKFLEGWKEAGNSVNELVVTKLTDHYKRLIKIDAWDLDD